MLQLYFANLEVREDLLAGPMGPYLLSLAVKLSELGYSRDQARRLLVTADALGQWLKQQGVTPTEATADHVRAYAASQQRTPAGKLRDTATGLTHLVGYLKPTSGPVLIACCADATAQVEKKIRAGSRRVKRNVWSV